MVFGLEGDTRYWGNPSEADFTITGTAPKETIKASLGQLDKNRKIRPSQLLVLVRIKNP